MVSSILMAPIKAIPVIGDLVDSTTDELLENFQQKKEKELIDVILNDSNSITTEMVNDVEFIINYARVVDAVRRLELFKKVCRKYLYLYPEIYAYKDMYEDDECWGGD